MIQALAGPLDNRKAKTQPSPCRVKLFEFLDNCLLVLFIDAAAGVPDFNPSEQTNTPDSGKYSPMISVIDRVGQQVFNHAP